MKKSTARLTATAQQKQQQPTASPNRNTISMGWLNYKGGAANGTTISLVTFLNGLTGSCARLHVLVLAFPPFALQLQLHEIRDVLRPSDLSLIRDQVVQADVMHLVRPEKTDLAAGPSVIERNTGKAGQYIRLLGWTSKRYAVSKGKYVLFQFGAAPTGLLESGDGAFGVFFRPSNEEVGGPWCRGHSHGRRRQFRRRS